MSYRMSNYERLLDISNKCGVSINIVRAVLKAECQSVVESLAKGDSASLIGRCSINVTPWGTMENGEVKKTFKIKMNPTVSLVKEMDKYINQKLGGNMDNITNNADEITVTRDDILATQISVLE